MACQASVRRKHTGFARGSRVTRSSGLSRGGRGNLWVRYQDKVGDFTVDENTDGALLVTGACRRQEDSCSLGTEV